MKPLIVENIADLSQLRDRMKCGDALKSQAEVNAISKMLAGRRKTLRPREKDEEFSLVNTKGKPRKITAQRWLCHLLNLRHTSVHILLTFRHPGLGLIYLFQVRSWNKADSPGYVDISIGGHVGMNPSSSAATLEMQEEFGLSLHDLTGGSLRHIGGYHFQESRSKDNFFNCEWREVYMGELTTTGFQNLQFNDGEVAGLFCCPEKEAANLLRQSTIPIASALKESLPFCLRSR